MLADWVGRVGKGPHVCRPCPTPATAAECAGSVAGGSGRHTLILAERVQAKPTRPPDRTALSSLPPGHTSHHIIGACTVHERPDRAHAATVVVVHLQRGSACRSGPADWFAFWPFFFRGLSHQRTVPHFGTYVHVQFTFSGLGRVRAKGESGRLWLRHGINEAGRRGGG